MKKAWVISLLAIVAFFGDVSPSGSAFAQTQSTAFTPVRLSLQAPARFEMQDDRFIRAFGSPRMPSSIQPERRPALSRIRMSIKPAALEETLPRHAPGIGPDHGTKADRDQGMASIGRVFISQHGLTVNLF